MTKTKKKTVKKNITPKGQKSRNKGFEKAWEFWKNAHVDLKGFKFDREEVNAR